MKRRVIAFAVCLAAFSSLFAGVVPIKNYVDYGVFASPGRLVDVDSITPFGIEAEAVSDAEAIKFLASPAASFKENAEIIAEYLSSQDIEFWDNHPELINEFASIDSAFPVRGNNTELYEAELQDYFRTRFLSSSYGDNNRAIAALSVIEQGVIPDNLKPISGDIDLSLKIYGGRVSSGSGWNAGLDLLLEGPESLFSSSAVRGIDSVIHSEHGIAGYIVPEKLSAGFAVTPSLFLSVPFSGTDFVNARFEDLPLNLILNGSVYMGLGMGFNFGIMYKPLENLSFSLDLRDVASARIGLELPISDIAAGLRFYDNIMIIPPDVAFSVVWNARNWHLKMEINDIVNQLIANEMLGTTGFSWWNVVDGEVSYDFSENLSLALSYEDAEVGLEVMTGGFKAALLARTDSFGFGVRCGFLL